MTCSQCAGTGYRWKTKFYEVMCWRCVGRGTIADVTNKNEHPEH